MLKRDFKKNKGQIGIFIVIGIIIIVLFGIMINTKFGNELTDKTNIKNSLSEDSDLSDLGSVEDYVNLRLEDTIYEGLFVTDSSKLEDYVLENIESKFDFNGMFSNLNITHINDAEIQITTTTDKNYLNVRFNYDLIISDLSGEGSSKLSKFQIKVSLKSSNNLFLSDTGKSERNIEIKSMNGAITLDIYEDNYLFKENGEPIDTISVEINESASTSENLVLDMKPDGATFTSPIFVTVDYSMMNLPDNFDEKYLVILGLNQDGSGGDLIYPTYVNTEYKFFIAPIMHFSSYSVTTDKKKKCTDSSSSWCASGKGKGQKVSSVGSHRGFSCWSSGCNYDSESAKVPDTHEGKLKTSTPIKQTHSIEDFKKTRSYAMQDNSDLTKEKAGIVAMKTLNEKDRDKKIDDAIEDIVDRIFAEPEPMSKQEGNVDPDPSVPKDIENSKISSDVDVSAATKDKETRNSQTGSERSGGESQNSNTGDNRGADSSECFTFDQLVSTPKGNIQINKLKIGDIVISYDENLEKLTYSEIGEILIHDGIDLPIANFKVNNLIQLGFKDKFGYEEFINVTDNHQFYNIKTGNYKEIRDFNIGEELFNKDKKIIISSKKILIDNTSDEIVYNIHMVNKPHNYFVKGVLVHNWK